MQGDWNTLSLSLIVSSSSFIPKLKTLAYPGLKHCFFATKILKSTKLRSCYQIMSLVCQSVIQLIKNKNYLRRWSSRWMFLEVCGWVTRITQSVASRKWQPLNKTDIRFKACSFECEDSIIEWLLLVDVKSTGTWYLEEIEIQQFRWFKMTIKCPKLGSETTRLRLVVPLEFWTFFDVILWSIRV